MDTVGVRMAWYREVLRDKRTPPRLDAVLVEAKRSDEIILPNTRGVGQAPVWSTKPFRATSEDLERHEQDRTQKLMALQDLIADESVIYELCKTKRNPANGVCVGRAPRNDIVIDDGTVSTQHAVIEEVEGLHLLSDQVSSNGTFVNRKKLTTHEVVRLHTGDCVRFGGRVFYYLSGDRLLKFLGLRIVKQRKVE